MKRFSLTQMAIGIIVLLVTGILAAPSLFRTSPPASQVYSDKTVAMGRPLYASLCASCHGVNLEGQPNWKTRTADGTLRAPPHNESGHTWHHSDRVLFAYTKFGGQAALRQLGSDGSQSGMPAFDGQMTDEEIWSVLAFIKSSWSDRARKAQADRSRADPPS